MYRKSSEPKKTCFQIHRLAVSAAFHHLELHCGAVRTTSPRPDISADAGPEPHDGGWPRGPSASPLRAPLRVPSQTQVAPARGATRVAPPRQHLSLQATRAGKQFRARCSTRTDLFDPRTTTCALQIGHLQLVTDHPSLPGLVRASNGAPGPRQHQTKRSKASAPPSGHALPDDATKTGRGHKVRKISKTDSLLTHEASTRSAAFV